MKLNPRETKMNCKYLIVVFSLALAFCVTGKAECTKEKIAKAAKAYRYVDLNHDGIVEPEEAQTAGQTLIDAYQVIGFTRSAIAQRYDLSRDGAFAPGDILVAVSVARKGSLLDCSYLHARAFSLLDHNQDGIFSSNENSAAQNTAYNVANQGKYLAAVDYDDNGEVAYSGGTFKYYGRYYGDLGAAGVMWQLYGTR